MIRVTRGLLTLIAGVSAVLPFTAIAQIAAKSPISSDAMSVHLRAKRTKATSSASVDNSLSSTADPITFNSEQGPGPGAIGPGPGCDLFRRRRP